MRVKGYRSPLGVSGLNLFRGVCIDAIPFLTKGFEKKGTGVGDQTLTIIGDAPKDFITVKPTYRYIAKGPRREGPIECVTEYLIGRIGTMLPLRVAEGRLVRLPPTTPGIDPDVRFMSRYFLASHTEQLLHGSQIIAACFELKEDEVHTAIPKGKEWSFYTYDLVVGAFAHLWELHKRSLTEGFARMMAFDALVGANDRHPQNWGVITSVIDKKVPPRFSPIFDTARGLCWNVSEDRLETYDRFKQREEWIAGYADASVPLIGLNTSVRPNHFHVIASMLRRSDLRAPIVDIIRSYDCDSGTRLLHREFRTLLSRRRLEYIDQLLRYRHARLISLCQTELAS